jgi:hypothetical protein
MIKCELARLFSNRCGTACLLPFCWSFIFFSGLGFAGAALAQEKAIPLAAPAVQNAEAVRLEISEQLSESLANEFLDLSLAVRDRDEAAISHYLPESLESAPFPANPLLLKSDVKWISSHGWTGQAATDARISRTQFLREFMHFLSHFSEIEDARFKVKLASFDDSSRADLSAEIPTAIPGATGKARVAFFVVGRDPAGKREWARGTAEVQVRYTDVKYWNITVFKLVSLDSMIGTTELFSEVSTPAGIAVTRPAFGAPGSDGFTYRGAVAADFNGDGWMDLFVCGSERNFLYLNDGKGRFREATHEAGLDNVEPCVGAVALDYDNDGDQDLFLTNIGPQMLLRNRLQEDGVLKFEDVSLKSGVARAAVGFSAAVGDVNGDGLPDIYVTSYNHYGRVVPDSWFKATNGTPNLLFLNQGNGTFKEEASNWGVDDSRWSYAAEFADVDGDGKLDLYVVNDFGEKALFINKGDHFVDQAAERGVLDPGNGMGVSFGDFNNDGLLDLHVTNMSSTAGNRILSRLFPSSGPKDNVLKKLAAGNFLYQNLGGGQFKDVTADVGGLSAGWAWGGGFIDFDNDGWEDIYSPNGFISGKSMKDT